jgi:anti-anti-sigma factor
MSNVGRLERVVASVAAKRPERIVFDLGGLRFMDSAGIAVLLGAAAKAGVVHLREPSRGVRRVIELTGLTELFAIEP